MMPRRLGFLIPEFPQQTHIAWWRVSQGMRQAGVDVTMLSTRRPDRPCPHPQLREAARDTQYLFPPGPEALRAVPHALLQAPAIAAYLRSLQPRESLEDKLKLAALVASAVQLLNLARERSIDHFFVHSCADAAHVFAMCRHMGGPGYSLRLGGDLEVYGGDHRSKMARATLIVPAARAYNERLIREVGVPEERILWSWVGTDTDSFTPGVPRSEGPLRIVTVARLNVSKGYQFALPAMQQLVDRGIDFTYQIIGAGPYEDKIRELLSDLPSLKDRVTLLGSRSTDEIAAIHRESDVFLLPTSGIGEGTPAAVCEAMSAGLPVVATDVGGLRDMLTDGVEGFVVPPGDTPAIADGLTKLAADTDARLRMARAARAKAEQDYDFRVVARRILDRIAALPPG